MVDALTPALVRQLFDYRDGVLFWQSRPVRMFVTSRACEVWNARFAGKPAGYIHKVRSGHRRRVTISVYGLSERHYASRLVWAWQHGRWPFGIVDHEDGDTLNDRIGNLRDVTDAANSQNAKRHIDNTSGILGVCWHAQRRKWKAEITANGVRKHLGVFDALEAAAAARKSAEIEMGFHPNHGRDANV